jgi:N-acetylmuramoyl-L-alanine amidase
LDLLSLNRPVSLLIIHCSATPPDMDIGAHEITKWHKDRGWSDIGYHGVIRRDGTYEDGRDINKVGAHVKGYNTGSIGICLVGGVDKNNDAEDNFTDAQYRTLSLVCRGAKAVIKDLTIHGHREFDKGKECPSFSVQKWLKSENI